MLDLTSDPRAAGEIVRYHTWSMHNHQSVGEHTWQVLRIMLTVWPSCPKHVIVYVVVHDMGEMAGDIPYPFKQLVVDLKPAMLQAESIVRDYQRKTLGIPEDSKTITPFQMHAFKACEHIEMWECGLREVNMGNRYALLVRDRMLQAVSKNFQALEAMEGTQEYSHNPGLVKSMHRYMTERMRMEESNG
jgi:hypothetical protein